MAAAGVGDDDGLRPTPDGFATRATGENAPTQLLPTLIKPPGEAAMNAPTAPTPVIPSPRSPVHDGPPALMGQPEVIEAELMDEPGRDLVVAGGRPVVASAATAEVVSALTEVAFREARTDEWIMEPRPPDVRTEAPVRPGPPVLDADPWHTAALPVVEADYQGRRRAASPPSRLWIVIGLVVVALSAAVALPFLLTSPTGSPSAERSQGLANLPATQTDGDISGISSPGPDGTGNGTGMPPVAGASPQVTTTAAADSPAPSASSTAPFAPFAAITVEAEAGGTATSWGGTATRSNVAGASRGAVIDRIGEHWPGGSANGYVEFRNIAVTDGGNYTMTVYYVYAAFGNDNPRRLTITTNGSGAQSATFSSTATVQSRAFTVNLQSGIANTIRLTDNSAQSPAIDKIVISRP